MFQNGNCLDHLHKSVMVITPIIYVPSENSPIMTWKNPHARVRMMAYVGSPCIGDVPKAAVIRDMMAVGPNVMSLDVPRKQYTKHPINAEYSPY